MQEMIAHVRSVFSFLLEKNCSVHAISEDAGDFGNTLIEIRCVDLRLRVVRDRGQEFVLFAGRDQSENWFDLELVMEAVLRVDSVSGMWPMSLEKAAELIRRHWIQIWTAFAEPNFAATRNQMEELKGKRARKMFPSLYSDGES